ncbi:MAG TPA: hypothetical protein VLS89_14535 [Candidatus Nanopelagicales bacterium]|nr:hypothetical protein [Candidatus Nanopelagicales bacterium]
MSEQMNAFSNGNQSDPSAAGDPAGGERDVSGAVALFSALLVELAPHAPSAEAVAQWQGMIADEEARVDGVSVSSDRIIGAAMTEFAAMVPYLLQEPLPGYGPRRAHYAVGLGLEHARVYAAFLETEARRAEASGSKGSSTQDAREQRAHLLGLLLEATEGDAALQAAVAKAARRGTKLPADVSASLQGLSGVGRELLERAAQRPGLAEVLVDMELTEAVIAQAEDAARALGTARGTHDAQKAAHREESDELNTFDGRLWFELTALQRAAERARSKGRRVPAVRLATLARRRRSGGEAAGAAGESA